MSGVVSIHGHEIPPAGQPVADVIEVLEKALDRARSGDINGVIVVMTHADELVSLVRHAKCTYRLIGALQVAVAELCQMQIDP